MSHARPDADRHEFAERSKIMVGRVATNKGYTTHVLISHAGAERLTSPPRDFDGLAAWLADTDFEGIVWHHPDGRMAKLKRRDFA